MVKEISKILKDRIVANEKIKFLDVVAGLTQRVTYSQPIDGKATVCKSLPVSYDVDASESCQVNPETAVVPDSTKKGILYFEESGTNIQAFNPVKGATYTSNLTLVCWLNKARLGYEKTDEITAAVISLVLGAVVSNVAYANVGSFIKLNVKPGRINVQDSSVFNKYTYDELATQYLRPPFEFFSIQLSISYSINPNCLQEFLLKDPVCY